MKTAGPASVRFEDLKIDKNIRIAYGDLQALAVELEQDGLIDPIDVKPDMTILRGHRRHAAMSMLRATAKAKGKPTPFDEVPVIIRTEVDDTKRIALQLLDRDGPRKNLTGWENAKAFLELKQNGVPVTEIMKISGNGQQHVRALIQVAANLCPDLQKTFDKGLEVPVSLLYALGKLHEKEQKEEFQKWLDRKDRKRAVKGTGGIARPRKVLRRTRLSDVNVEALLRDLRRDPKQRDWKSAIVVLRYLTGETDTRPVATMMLNEHIKRG